LTYLGVTNAFALLRLLAMNDHDKDAEILVLRHQITVLQRQLSAHKARFEPADRGLPGRAAAPSPPPHTAQTATAGAPGHHPALAPQPARPPPRCPVPTHAPRPTTHRALGSSAGLAPGQRESDWGYRRIHGELLVLGITVAASTVWQTLKDAGIDPAPERAASAWADFLHSQAHALLACDFFVTHTLSGTPIYVFAVIEHAHRRIRILGATAHPTAAWVTQAGRNLVMDLADTGARARFMIRDRDTKFPSGFDAVLADAGIRVVLTGVRIPRMNAIMERWIQTCRRELLDRTLIWNQRHLAHALREFERFYNGHRPHQGIANARPLHPLPPLIANPARIAHLDIRRHDRLGGTLHEYQHAA
jgi:transposase InsO family protein